MTDIIDIDKNQQQRHTGDPISINCNEMTSMSFSNLIECDSGHHSIDDRNSNSSSSCSRKNLDENHLKEIDDRKIELNGPQIEQKARTIYSATDDRTSVWTSLTHAHKQAELTES